MSSAGGGGTRNRRTYGMSTIAPPGAQRMVGGQAATVIPAAGGRPALLETNHRLSGDTAGTGGIREIGSFRRPDRSLEVSMQGVLLPGLVRSAPTTPNYNAEALRGSDVGLSDYEVAHLWGPGFGDEARDGMMLAPREVNQAFQNHGIESRLRELQTQARAQGGTILVFATAEGHPLGTPPARGEDMLSHASYRFELSVPNQEPVRIGEVDIWVPPPGASGSPSGQVKVEITGGSSGLWSLK